MRGGRRYPAWLVAGLLSWLVTGAVAAAEWTARLDWQRRLELSTPVSGIIREVPVRPDQRVAKGDLLVGLDQRLFDARLDRARARLAKAREERDEAVRELERTQELFERTLLSVHDLQLAQIAATGAEADHSSAEMELAEAEIKLEYSRILAPFDARVVSVPAQSGETVVSRLQARTLVVVAPAGRMRARAWVDGEQLQGLSVGMAAEVAVGERSYPAEVSGVALEPGKGSDERPLYRLEVDFALPPDRVLRPQQAAKIRIEINK